MKEHTRNQRRMYRIHKQDEKILAQELIISSLQNRLQQKENIIKEVREVLENKRETLTSLLLSGRRCNYEELLYQLDEEIGNILDKGSDKE